MHKELLIHSPVLGLPLGALVLFLAVFLVVVVRTMRRKGAAYSDVEQLPLMHDEGRRVEPEENGHGDP
ncbi:MAG TPA: hypothetical protein VLM85_28675 [Polyangiaceae bacterium]|nr:hypothetical protein [Polyangiaceae bacterium]